MPRILILSQPNDRHAYAVSAIARRKGGIAEIWHTTDFPMRGTETVSISTDVRFRISTNSGGVDCSTPFHSVWRRRPALLVDGLPVHPADREVAELGCRNLRDGLVQVLAPDAFWVNSVAAARSVDHKVAQIVAARNVGLIVPATLFTNDPAEIRMFIRQHGGSIAFKPFRSLPWRNGNEYFMAYTAVISEESLVKDQLLRAAPGIYQQLVSKRYELRATFVGNRPFVAKVLSQETRFGTVDWRKSYGELRMEPYDLPVSVADKCRALMRHFGIVFGCFDFIVTPEGEYVFLEVNQMGQFLFAEGIAGLPIADAFTEFLMQRRLDFQWPNPQGIVRYADVVDGMEAQMAADADLHVVAESETWSDVVDPLPVGSM